MTRYAVIGLGNFGHNVARTLFELGREVIVLDQDEKRVHATQEFASFGLVGASTDPEVLAALQIPDLDTVFVSLGDDLAGSVMTTLLLSDLNAKHIVVKITSLDHGRVLKKVGAHDVVFPERDMAVQVARAASSPAISSYLDLDPEYSLAEITPLSSFIGKTLAETGLRATFGINVIGIKDHHSGKLRFNPSAAYVVKDSDNLLVIGHRNDLARLADKRPDA